MIRRFGIFVIGIVLGVAFVNFAFPGRFAEMTQYFSLDYRVIYHLDQDTVYMSAQAQCHLDCLGLEQSDVLQVLQDGTVNFSKSKKDAHPCKLYLVEKNQLAVAFELCDDQVRVKDFSLGEDTCQCH